MANPVASSTQLFLVDNEQTGDVDITSFGSPWTDVDSVAVSTNAAPNGVNEGIRLRQSSPTAFDQQAGGHALSTLDFTDHIIYTGHRAKQGGNNGASFANGGYGIGLRDTSSRFRAWKWGGFDDGYDNDFMRERICDPSVAGDEVEDGSFDITAINAIFWFATAETTTDHDTIILQGFAIGPVTVTRGDTTTPATLDDFQEEFDNAGDYDLIMMTKFGGSTYRPPGKLVFGSNDALEHRFDQESFAMEFIQRINDVGDGTTGERYGAVVGDNNFGITLDVSSNFYFRMATGVINNINPWHFIITNNSNTSETILLESMSFTNIGNPNFDSPALFTATAFTGCAKILVKGATLDACTIKGGVAGIAALITTSSDVNNSTFETVLAEDHAIEVATAGPYTLTSVTLTGYGPALIEFDTGTDVSSGNDTITSTGHGYTTEDAIYYEDQGGVQNIGLTDSTKYFVRAVDVDTLAFYTSAANATSDTSRINLTSGGSETQEIASAKAAFFNNYTGADVTLNITDGSTPSIRNAPGASTTLVAGVTVTVTVQEVDATVISGASVYLRKTGGGAEILNTTSNGSGIATATYSDTTPQVVEGWVRKATTGTLYKEFPLGGSITSAGYTQTAIMSEDE